MARVSGRGYSASDDATLLITDPVERSRVINSITRNYEARRDSTIPGRDMFGRTGYNMTATDAIAAAALMDRSKVASPFVGMPVAASSGNYSEEGSHTYEAIQFMDDESGNWSDYWQSEQIGYDYSFDPTRKSQATLPKDPAARARALSAHPYAGMDPIYVDPHSGSQDTSPAPISLMPTSTINPDRPRTVAAGYDYQRKVLTVVFRDGTFYNYYDVTRREWDGFRRRKSKGRYIRDYLDSHPRGQASMGAIPIYAREALYKVARTAQWVGDGHKNAQYYRRGRKK